MEGEGRRWRERGWKGRGGGGVEGDKHTHHHTLHAYFLQIERKMLESAEKLTTVCSTLLGPFC